MELHDVGTLAGAGRHSGGLDDLQVARHITMIVNEMLRETTAQPS